MGHSTHQPASYPAAHCWPLPGVNGTEASQPPASSFPGLSTASDAQGFIGKGSNEGRRPPGKNPQPANGPGHHPGQAGQEQGLWVGTALQRNCTAELTRVLVAGVTLTHIQLGWPQASQCWVQEMSLQPPPDPVQPQSLRDRVGGHHGTTESLWGAGVLGGPNRHQDLQDTGPQAVFPLPDTGPQCLPWFCRAAAVARPGSQGRVHIHPPPGPWWQMSPGPGTRTGPSCLWLLGALALWGQEESQKAWRKCCSPASGLWLWALRGGWSSVAVGGAQGGSLGRL